MVMGLRGVLQKELGRLAGINPVQISQWVNGKGTAGTGNAGKLAAALGTTTDWLLHGIGAPPEKETVARGTEGKPRPGVNPAILDAFFFGIARVDGASAEDFAFARERIAAYCAVMPAEELPRYLSGTLRPLVEERILKRTPAQKAPVTRVPEHVPQPTAAELRAARKAARAAG